MLRVRLPGPADAAWSEPAATCPPGAPGGAGIGGPAPYQLTLAYDNAGTANGSQNGTTGIPYDTTLITGPPGSGQVATENRYSGFTYGTPQPHAPSAQATTVTTGGGSTTVSSTMNWDAAGSQPGYLSSVLTGGYFGGTVTASYDWDGTGMPAGQLATATAGTGPSQDTASYRYDAAGLLATQDATSAATTLTVYLPGQELTATTAMGHEQVHLRLRDRVYVRCYPSHVQRVHVRCDSGSCRVLSDGHGVNRLAAVDERGGRLFVQSWSQTRGKFPLGVQNEWLEIAHAMTADKSLGHLVRLALSESQAGVPNGNVAALAAAARRKTLIVAGVKSYAAYERRVRRVFIALNEDEKIVEITPYQNGGKDRNFTSIAGAEIRLVADADDALLGSEIRRALRIAT